MDMKQVVAGAQGAPMQGAPMQGQPDKTAQAVELLKQAIFLLSGEEQAEDQGKQAGFESVDQGGGMGG